MYFRSNQSKPGRRKLLAAGGFAGVMALLCAAVHTLRATEQEFPEGYAPHPTSIAVVGDQAITTDEYYQVLLWDLNNLGAQPADFEGHAKKAAYVSVSNGRVFTAGYDGTVNVALLATPKPAKKFKEHHSGPNKPEVWCVAVSTDGSRAVSSTNDGQILVWKTKDPYNNASVEADLRSMIPAPIEEVGALAFIPGDKNHFISGHWDARMYLWDLSNLANVKKTEFPQNPDLFPISSVAVAKGGTLAATGSFNNTVTFWDVTNKTRAAFQPDPAHAHTEWVWRVAFSQDGSKLASAGEDGLIKIWNATNGAFIRQFNAGSDGSMGVAWRDDHTVVFIGDGRTDPVQMGIVPE
jgi:WD40 repeat protein